MKITVTAGAFDDVRKGVRFYERDRKGLGERFEQVVLGEIASLAFYAGIHPKRIDGSHRTLIAKFPFAVHYLKDDDEVLVVAVVDLRQNPARTERRLRQSRSKRPRP